MLTSQENELLTRTGPGTAMGETMRRYWIPALLSSELPVPDCPPLRVKLMGESLVAFRDSTGRVGLVGEFCAHRRASLFLGRNEEKGLRCVFHGWKYDVDGFCIDMPNEPAESGLRNTIRLKAYCTVELGGVIWTYMGPAEKKPPDPGFEWDQMPESHRHVTKVWEECNWLQALEGGLDTAHISFLHWGLDRSSAENPHDPVGFRVRSQAPALDLDLTDYGLRYAGIRPLGEQGNYVRVYHFVMPFHQIRPHQAIGARERGNKGLRWLPLIKGHMWVPMDDQNCMVYNWTYSFGEALTEGERLEHSTGNWDVDGNFRKVRNKDNDWFIDRDAQKSKSYTGIQGINIQDHAIQESMGPIVDRTGEHLVATDKAIIAARLLLLNAVRTVQQGGDPAGASSNYNRLRAIERILPHGTAWREALLGEIEPKSSASIPTTGGGSAPRVSQ